MTMRIKRHHGGFWTAIAAAFTALLLPACILDTDKQVLLTASDIGTDRDSVDFDTADRDPDLPDIDISPEISDCDVECPPSWFPACSGETVWCVTPYRSIGNCCEAWQDCQDISTTAFPGIWATAGPYNGVVPPDFFDRMDLPGITIVFSIDNAGGKIANISCFDENGEKQPGAGETHALPESMDCSSSPCEEYTNTTDCPGDVIGCGCALPYWCVDYSMNPVDP
jgi:hypothetical protein